MGFRVSTQEFIGVQDLHRRPSSRTPRMPVFMGKKYLRIKKNNEFQKIFAKGKRGFSARLTLLYTPSDTTRMGICVGKKHGGSVTRNRIKRLLREIFRLNAESIKKNYSYILVPKTAEKYDYRELEKDFLYILKKQDLLVKREEKGE